MDATAPKTFSIAWTRIVKSWHGNVWTDIAFGKFEVSAASRDAAIEAFRAAHPARSAGCTLYYRIDTCKALRAP